MNLPQQKTQTLKINNRNNYNLKILLLEFNVRLFITKITYNN